MDVLGHKSTNLSKHNISSLPQAQTIAHTKYVYSNAKRVYVAMLHSHIFKQPPIHSNYFVWQKIYIYIFVVHQHKLRKLNISFSKESSWSLTENTNV